MPNKQQSRERNVAGTDKAPQVLVTLKITGTRNEPKDKNYVANKSIF